MYIELHTVEKFTGNAYTGFRDNGGREKVVRGQPFYLRISTQKGKTSLLTQA